MAIASVKSETDMPMSRVSGCMKMPSDCRSPMLSVSISDAPIRIGKVGRRICKRGVVFKGVVFKGIVFKGTVFLLPLGRGSNATSCNCGLIWSTQTCVTRL